MPKMKTDKGAHKRFKKTANGFKRKHCNLRHILTKKSTKNKRQLRHPAMADETNVKNMKKILPYI